MGFDFFKKKGDKRRKGDGDESPFADDLEFDDIETSGEFLSGSEHPGPPPPSPPPVPRAAPYQPPPPPPPARTGPPAPVQHSRPAAPPSYPPPGQPVDNDITVVNRPPVIPRNPAGPPPGPQVPRAPQAPVPPGPPAAPSRPMPPGPPAHQAPPPPTAPIRPPVGHQPDGLADDEVTQVLNKPVSHEAVVAWLVVSEGTMRGEDFRLPSGTARLGHHPQCDIRITGDTFVSTQHAELRFQGGTYWIHDLASTNGLFVNGARTDQAALNDGDLVKAGTTTMIFKCVKI